MTRTRANIVANFAGRFWTAALSLLLIPAYIKLLGPEGYGFVALFATVQTIINIFDLGATSTIAREMARFSADPERAPQARSLARTIEAAYWGIGVLIGLLFALAVPLIARSINAGGVAPQGVRHVLLLMDVVIVLQWPLTFYGGATMGLQRQVLWNAINASGLALRGIGAVLVIRFVSPTVMAFFVWQAVASAVHTTMAMVTMWYVVPRVGEEPRVRPALLRQVYRFALAVSGLMILIVVLSQIDRVMLIRVVPLAVFGEYAVAATVAAAIFYCSSPIGDWFLPRLSQLAVGGDRAAMAATYHTGCQLQMIATAPVVAVLTLFPETFLRIWTHDSALAGRIHVLLMLLVAGQALNVAMAMLDMLQAAYGWMKPALVARVLAVVVMGPLMAYAVLRYGTYGAAAVWFGIFVMYFAVAPRLVFRTLLPSEMARWYLQDVLLPLAVALSLCAVLRWLVVPPAGWWSGLLLLSAAGGGAMIAAAAVLPAGRAAIRIFAASILRTPAATTVTLRRTPP